VDGVPYLKDLPLLGYIFRYEEDRNDTDELLLIVRPTIIPVGSKRDVVYAPVTELNHTSIK
jgi:type II secretory pathway component GspD/PulD (secretin)